MENTNAPDSVDFSNFSDEMDEDVSSVEYKPSPIQVIMDVSGSETPVDKATYLLFIQALTSQHEVSSALGTRVMAKVAQFDKELVKKFKACQDAEDALVSYCRSKLEGSGPTPVLTPAPARWPSPRQ